MAGKAWAWAGRRAPELILAALAAAVFLGFLGSGDLWGKREQRASAEAVDTVEHGHWLVAQIQGRPRLEKPPLPRWTIAGLMILTGRRDEWVVRLPGALSGLGVVALTYALGCRLGGRAVGRAAGLILSSSTYFFIEARQAGNDGPLALFTTLALYAAWRRLHGEPGPDGSARPGARGWARLMYVALGLGVLTKGPVILALVAVTVVPYLALGRRLREGLRLLVDGPGLVVFALLALSWPVPVLLRDPHAARVWYLEMAQKAGTAGVEHHRARLLILDWPWMAAPWLAVTASAIVLPLRPRGREFRPAIWFPWCWAVGNLAMFCAWHVAKPNYYLPCLPGAAVLAAIEWVRLSREAREPRPGWPEGKRMLQLHWVVLFAGALAAPAVIRQVAPELLGWASLLSAVLAAAVLASAWTWRRGSDAGALAPLAGALAVGVLVGYGAVVPRYDALKGHRGLAATLDRMLNPSARTVMFYRELDEGLWFYLRGRELRPIPGSQPRYNDAVDRFDEYRQTRALRGADERFDEGRRRLVDWVRRPDRPTPYVLMRSRTYDRFATDLAGLVEPVYRERGLSRNELILLRVAGPEPLAARAEAAHRD